MLSELPLIQRPVLLLTGEKDRTVALRKYARPGVEDSLGNYPDLSRAAAKKIPKCTRVDIPGVGHAPHLEAPEAFQSAVLPFLLRDRPDWLAPVGRSVNWASSSEPVRSPRRAPSPRARTPPSPRAAQSRGQQPLAEQEVVEALAVELPAPARTPAAGAAPASACSRRSTRAPGRRAERVALHLLRAMASDRTTSSIRKRTASSG